MSIKICMCMSWRRTASRVTARLSVQSMLMLYTLHLMRVCAACM